MPATPPDRLTRPTGHTVGPAPRLEHMSGLDGLRAVAVTAVIVYHFQPSWLPGGFIGVDVFFVLSGFLITSLLLRERITTGQVDYARFFARRLRRLMPALLVLLLALSVYAVTWAEPAELSRLRRHGLATVAYVTNWVFIADGTTYTDILVGTSPLRHVWSLAIEEQLYLVLALGVLAAAAFGRPTRLRHRFGSAAGVLAVCSALWMMWLSWGGASVERTYFGTDTRAQTMLVGAVLGAVLVGRPAGDRPALRWVGWISVAVLALVAWRGAEDARWLHSGGFSLVAVAGAGLVVASASDPLMRKMLSTRPLVLVGTISYGLYLWHWPVLVIFDQQRTGLDDVPLTALRLALSVAAATISYTLVERPIRSGVIGRRFGTLAVVPAAASIVAVVGILVVSTTVATPNLVSTVPELAANRAPDTTDRAVDRDPNTGDLTAPVGDPLDRSPAPEGAPDPIAAPTEPSRVAVLGDSVVHTIIGGEVSAVGMQFSPWTPEQSSFDPAQVEVTSIAMPGCSLLPEEIAILEPNGSYSHASMERFCGDWRGELAATLPRVEVLLVHLSNDLEDRWVDGEHFAFGTDDYFDLLGTLLDEVYTAASNAGIALLLVASAPRTDASWPEPLGERERRVADFYREWASTRQRVTTVDLGEVVCPGGSCPDQVDGELWRWDGRHYTAAGARGAAEWLTPAIRAAASTTAR